MAATSAKPYRDNRARRTEHSLFHLWPLAPKSAVEVATLSTAEWRKSLL